MKARSAPVLLIAAAALVSLAGCAAPPAARISAEADQTGRALAQRLCGECHAVGQEGGAGRLADAPAFVDLRGRISRADLAVILQQRSVEGHPRMPTFSAEDDEVVRLLDYWDELDPTRRPRA